jgi:hypothetical protein
MQRWLRLALRRKQRWYRGILLICGKSTIAANEIGPQCMSLSILPERNCQQPSGTPRNAMWAPEVPTRRCLSCTTTPTLSFNTTPTEEFRWATTSLRCNPVNSLVLEAVAACQPRCAPLARRSLERGGAAAGLTSNLGSMQGPRQFTPVPHSALQSGLASLLIIVDSTRDREC